MWCRRGGAPARRSSPWGWRAVVVVVVVTSCGVLIAACGRPDTTTSTPGAGTPVPGYPYLNPLGVDDLLAAITHAGLDAPNPRNVTQQECPAIGCTDMVATDTVTIIKFATPGQAELYAGSTRHAFQIEDVVLTFAPSVPSERRRAYDDAVKRAIA